MPALVALGANLPAEGRSAADTLRHALQAIAACGWRVEARSRWYRTPAVPEGSGPDFVNGAARLSGGPEGLSGPALAEALLADLHAVERALGRERRARWAPRVCDLDLLALGDLVHPDRATVADWMALDLAAAQTTRPESLLLPHPRLHERAFVLVPLAEVAGDWRHPLTGQSVQQMRDALPANERDAARPMPPSDEDDPATGADIAEPEDVGPIGRG